MNSTYSKSIISFLKEEFKTLASIENIVSKEKILLFYTLFYYDLHEGIYASDILQELDYFHYFSFKFRSLQKEIQPIHHSVFLNYYGNNTSGISYEEFVYFLKRQSGSIFILFYCFMFTYKTFRSDIIQRICHKSFDIKHYQRKYLRDILHKVHINQFIEEEISIYIQQLCDIKIKDKIKVKFIDEDNDEEVNEDEDDDDDDNVLSQLDIFEKDLITIKDKNIDNLSLNRIKTAFGKSPTIKQKKQTAVIKSNFLNLKSKNKMYESKALSFNENDKTNESSSIQYLSTSSLDYALVSPLNLQIKSFNATLPNENDIKINIVFSDLFMIINQTKGTEASFQEMIPYKMLYLLKKLRETSVNPVNRDNSIIGSNVDNQDNIVHLYSSFREKQSDFVIYFLSTQDKNEFINIISFLINHRLISNYYDFHGTLSKSKMGEVQIGTDKVQNKKVIIKTLYKKEAINYQWEVEINQYLRFHNHDYIIKMLDLSLYGIWFINHFY